MTVQNFECKIAKSQIGRYLSGEAMSSESLRQLEEHIAECAHCTQTVMERRAALQSMLEPAPATVKVSEPTAVAQVEPSARRRTLADRLVGAQAAIHTANDDERPLSGPIGTNCHLCAPGS